MLANADFTAKADCCNAVCQDEAPDTWEVKDNVAENVLRDFEDRWWTACREARSLGWLQRAHLSWRSCASMCQGCGIAATLCAKTGHIVCQGAGLVPLARGVAQQS